MAGSPTIELSELLGGEDDFVQLVHENRHVIITSHGSFLALVHAASTMGEAKEEAWKAYKRGASTCPQAPPFQVTPIGVFWGNLVDNIVDMTAERRAVVILTKEDAPIMVLQNFRFEVKKPMRQSIKAGLNKLLHRGNHATPPGS